MSFDPSVYWNERLSRDYSLQAVGFIGLGLPFNRWMYRVRRHVFSRAVTRAFGKHRIQHVLDLGSGTGFYVALWKELGAEEITGVDISEHAIAQLSSRWPDTRFILGDIGDPVPIPEATVDAVSAMDVLYHVMDDAKYRQALSTAARALRPGGFFFFTENLMRGPRQPAQYQAFRTTAAITAMLTEVGLRPVRQQPMFVLMNTPLHCAALRPTWRATATLVRLHPVLSWAVGAVLYPLELTLVAVLPNGPTTELLTCVKEPSAP